MKPSYKPADVAVIHPRNLKADVQLVIEHFEWQTVADRPFKLKPKSSGALFFKFSCL